MPTTSLAIGFTCSLIASFFLFAIAFNTSFSELRSSFLPVYFSIILVSFLVSLGTPKRRPLSLLAPLGIPVALITYIAIQKNEFFLDTLVIVAICLLLSSLADRLNKKRIDSDDTEAPRTKALRHDWVEPGEVVNASAAAGKSENHLHD